MYSAIAWALISASDKGSSEFFDTNIDLAKKLIQKYEGSPHGDAEPFQTADAYRKLGLLLQAKDARFHSAGILQIQALSAFDNSLQYAARAEDGYETEELILHVNFHKGILLKMMGDGTGALECYNSILNSNITSKADRSSVLSHMGDAYVMMHKLPEALNSFNKSLILTPCRLSVYLPMVEVHKEMNVFSQDDWLSLLKILFQAKKICEKGSMIDAKDNRVSVLSDPVLNADSSPIYFAIHSVAEKAKQYKLAWKYLLKAHEVELKNRDDPFNPEVAVTQANQILQIFLKGFWPVGVGYNTKKPAFIVGMMRSGSTLLETMLDAHQDILGTGEDSIFNLNLDSFRNAVVKTISGGDLKKLQKVIQKHGSYVEKHMLEVAWNASSTDSAKRKSRADTRVVDKMLFNYRNIGFIHLMYPKAVIIHIIRDPLDVMLSCFKHKFDDKGLSWTLNIDHLTTQYQLYLQIIAHFEEVLPGRILSIRYEDLVVNPDKNMRRILDELEVDWDPNVLEFSKFNRTVHTHSQQQVRQGLYRGSIGGWRKYSREMQPLIQMLYKKLSTLRKRKLLPFQSIMNWEFLDNYDYEKLDGSLLPKSANSVTSSSNEQDAVLDFENENDLDNNVHIPIGMDGNIQGNMIGQDGEEYEDDHDGGSASFISSEKGSRQSDQSSSGKSTLVKSTSSDSQFRSSVRNEQLVREKKISKEVNHSDSKRSGNEQSYYRIHAKPGDVISISKDQRVHLWKKSPDLSESTTPSSPSNRKKQSITSEKSLPSLASSTPSSSSSSSAAASKQIKNEESEGKSKATQHTAKKSSSLPSPSISSSSSNSLSSSSSSSISKHEQFIHALIPLSSQISDLRDELCESSGYNSFNLRNTRSFVFGRLEYSSSTYSIDTKVATHLEEIIAIVFLEIGKSDYATLTNQIHKIIYTISPAIAALSGSPVSSIGTSLSMKSIKSKWPVIVKEFCDHIIQYYSNTSRLYGRIGHSNSNSDDDYDDDSDLDSDEVIVGDQYFQMHIQSLLFAYIRVIHTQYFLIRQNNMQAHNIHQEELLLLFTALISAEQRHLLGRFLRIDVIMGADMANPFLLEELTVMQSIMNDTLHGIQSSAYYIPNSSTLLNLFNPSHDLELWVKLAEMFFRFQKYASSANVARTALQKIKSPAPKANNNKNDLLQSTKVSKAKLWNVLGKCEKELGNTAEGNYSQTMAIKLNPKMKEAYYDRAMVLAEAGFWELTLKNVKKAISMDPTFKLAYGYKGLLLQNLGHYEEAISDLSTCLQLDPSENQCYLLKAVSLQAIGKFTDSLKTFDLLIERNPAHEGAMFRREIAAYHYIHIDDDLATYTIDAELDPDVRQGHATGRNSDDHDNAPKNALPKRAPTISNSEKAKRMLLNYNQDFEIDTFEMKSSNLRNCFRENEKSYKMVHSCVMSCAERGDIDQVVQDTREIAEWIQLNTTGFIPHIGKHRAFGLSVLHMAQELRHHVHEFTRNGIGLIVPDSMSSKVDPLDAIACPAHISKGDVKAKDEGIPKACHIFSWRDFAEIAVRWRAMSEPMDVVWWIDLLPDIMISRSKEVLGLATYIVRSNAKIVRYYHYFDKAFQLTKMQLLENKGFDARDQQIILTNRQRQRVQSATTLQELNAAMFTQPFYIVAPCQSTLNHSNALKGTRITLTGTEAMGFSFSINTPSTIVRYDLYAIEMRLLFQSLVNELSLLYRVEQENPNDAAMINQRRDNVLLLGLKVFYYWVNLAPITRGSSATGYAILYACLLSTGYEFQERVPKDIQLDWEAMMSPTVAGFIDRVWPWMILQKPSPLVAVHYFDDYIGNPYHAIPGRTEDRKLCDMSDDSAGNDVHAPQCPRFCRSQLSQIFKTTRAMMLGVLSP